MSQVLQIHTENPQERLIAQAVEVIRQGGVVVYPTDTSYAIGCHLGDKKAVERIRHLRMLDAKHDFIVGQQSQKFIVESIRFEQYQLPRVDAMDMSGVDSSLDSMLAMMDDLRNLAMGQAMYGESCPNDFLGSGWVQNSDCSHSKWYDGGTTILKTTTDADGNIVGLS